MVSATAIPALLDGKADLVAAALEITDERSKQIDLSPVYFRTGQRILVKKDDTTINDVADLARKTVCTVRGSPSERTVVARSTEARLLSVDTYEACLAALQQGAADAVSADETTLFGLVRQDPSTKIVGAYFSDIPHGIGLRKGRIGFAPFLGSVIAAMVADGRWEALYQRHITPLSGDAKRAPPSPP